MIKTYWREKEMPYDDKEDIVVVYKDGSSMVTNWLDEQAENRIDEISRWLPINEYVDSLFYDVGMDIF